MNGYDFTVCNACGCQFLRCLRDQHGRCPTCHADEAPCPHWRCEQCGEPVESEYDLDQCDDCREAENAPYTREAALDDHWDRKYRASRGD